MECSRACLNGGGRGGGEGMYLWVLITLFLCYENSQFVMVRKYDNPHNAPKACCQTRYL